MSRSIWLRSSVPVPSYTTARIAATDTSITIATHPVRRQRNDAGSRDLIDRVKAVADRAAVEQDFHDVKEVHGAGQQQVRYYWANVAAFNLPLWGHTLLELWAWSQPAKKLADRRASPWDKPARRPSHADRLKALRRQCLEQAIPHADPSQLKKRSSSSPRGTQRNCSGRPMPKPRISRSCGSPRTRRGCGVAYGLRRASGRAKNGAKSATPPVIGDIQHNQDATQPARIGSVDVRQTSLDEPVNGLDVEGIRWIRTLLKGLADEGRTVFVSSHLMSEMAQMAEHVIVIGRGRLIADTSVDDIIARASADGRSVSEMRDVRGVGLYRTLEVLP